MRFKEQLKSARSAALSTVKSAPELRPRHRDKVPLMTSEALQDSGGTKREDLGIDQMIYIMILT